MRFLVLLSLLAVSCGGEGPTSPTVPIRADDVGVAVSYVIPTATATPIPTPDPTEEPVRRRATATPEPTSEPEPEPAPVVVVVNRADPTPTPWMSCDNPEYVPHISLVATGDVIEASYVLRSLRAVLPDGSDVIGGTYSPLVKEPLYYYRGDVDRVVTFRWSFVVSVAGGALVCPIELSTDVTIPAR